MACRVQVLLGPARSGKTARLVERYADRLAADMVRRTPGRALWIAPNRFAVENVRKRLLGRLPAGCFSPQVLTFEQFSELILATSPTPVRRISAIQKRSLVRQIVRALAAAGELPYLSRVAETPGLVDAIGAQISELKRLEIWPDALEKGVRNLFPLKTVPDTFSGKDVELARVYRDYQDLLTRHHLYDAEGRFWSARTLLAEGHRSCVTSFELVFVDGFTDLTRPQHEMLQSLAEEVEEMVISLPMDHVERRSPPARRDLFSKTMAMLDELQRRHGDDSRETRDESQEPDRNFWHSTLDSPLLSIPALADRLFRPPDSELPSGSAANAEIWETASPLREIQHIVRDIKQRLLTGDLCADDVVVVFRSLRDAAPLVEEAFAEYGVAAFVDVPRPIHDAAFVRNLLLLLRVDQFDWAYDDVLAVIRNRSIRWPALEAIGPATERGVRIAAERHARKLQISRGRAALLRQMRHAADSADGEDKEAVVQAAAGLEALAAYFDGLPKSATLAEWATVAEAIFSLCGAGSTASEADRSNSIDEQARAALTAALYGVHKLDERIGGRARMLTRAEALELFTDIAEHECLPQRLDTSGRVRVLSAIAARNVDARHLYFAGLAELAMPLAVAAQGYYSPRETARLIRAGLPLVGPQSRYEEEMLLFYEVISRARQRLVLSYAALDAKAQPILPSPFLEELRRVGGEVFGRLEGDSTDDRLEACPTVTVLRRLDLRPVDREAEPLCVREFRTRAVCDAVVDGGSTDRLHLVLAPREGDGQWGAGVFDGLSIVAARAEWDAFGPAEGLFTSAAAASRLAAEFGTEYPWSPTALEQFALCPFRFLMERVLEIEPLDDLELSTDYRRRGRLVHQCLAELYARLDHVESLFLSSHVDAERIKSEMLAFVADKLSRLEGGGYANALEALDLEQVRSFSETLHLQQQCYDGWNEDLDGPPWPIHFEVRFGEDREGDVPQREDNPSTDKTYALDLGDEQIELTGRVDRIDIGAVGGQKVFNIIDYKTGAPKPLSAKLVRQGLQLQTPLYAMAVEEHLLAEEGVLAWQADYWWLREAGFGNKGANARSGPFALRERTASGLVESEEWKALKAEIKDRIRQIVHGVRRGQFVVFSQDDNCTRTCPYSGVCRVGQVRSLEKEWNDGKGA